MYKEIYQFQALEELRKEKDVFVLDKEEKTCVNLRHLPVSTVLFILNEQNEFRYYFFEEETANDF